MTIFTDGLRQSSGVGIHELGTSLGQSLGATVDEAIDSMPVVSIARIGELSAAQGQVPDFGGMVTSDVTDIFTKQPEIPIGDAWQRTKEAGLESDIHLPASPTINTAALDIMMERAKARKEREATLARGPTGFIPGALSVGTSFLVSALDPLNIASAFIPVMGEARYAKLLADAGGAAGRTAVRAGVGAASGVVGQAAVEPFEAWARTQEGRDYTYADALHSLMFGAVLGGGLHAGGGAIADVYRSRKGTPLYPFAPGEPHFDREAGLFQVSRSDRAPAAANEPGAAGPALIDEGFLTPAPPKAERQQSLLEFLAARGGIRNDDPLIADVRSSIGSSNHRVGGGYLIREPKELSSAAQRGGVGKPMSLDEAREAAVEAGYLIDHGAEQGGVSTTKVSTLLDALDRELRGDKIYPKGERQQLSADDLAHMSEEEAFRRDGAATELEAALSEAGFKPGDISAPTKTRAVDLMVKGGVHEPLDAYERASAEGPSPIVTALDDLPPRAKEDLMRGAIGRLHDGEPVQASEQLMAGARTDTRIAEAIAPVRPEGQPAGEPDWHSLVGARREFDDPDSLAASQAAQNAPAPASVSPESNKRVQAAEAAQARAEAEYRDAEPYLPDDLKAKVEHDLAALEADLADRTEVIRRGAACLAAVAAGAAA